MSKNNTLLTLEERIVCEQITLEEAPHSQRATALIALDEGSTQAQAGERSGLTKGQLRYWLGQFKSPRPPK